MTRTYAHARKTILTQRMLTRSKGKSSLMVTHRCNICNNELEVDSEIVTKRTVGRAKWYHIECAKKVNII